MASALEPALGAALEGAVVTRYGQGAPGERIEVIEAAHPVPGAAGLRGRQDFWNGAAAELVIALITGGE